MRLQEQLCQLFDYEWAERTEYVVEDVKALADMVLPRL